MELIKYCNTINLDDGFYNNIIIKGGKISFIINNKSINGVFIITYNNGIILGGEFQNNSLLSCYKKNKNGNVKYFTVIDETHLLEI